MIIYDIGYAMASTHDLKITYERLDAYLVLIIQSYNDRVLVYDNV